jgi:hypothetical protein
MKQLTLKDLFTPENSGETYVKIAKYREAEAEIKEVIRTRLLWYNKLEKAEDKIKELKELIVLQDMKIASYLEELGEN